MLGKEVLERLDAHIYAACTIAPNGCTTGAARYIATCSATNGLSIIPGGVIPICLSASGATGLFGFRPELVLVFISSP